MNFKQKLGISVCKYYFKYFVRERKVVCSSVVFFMPYGLGDCLVITPAIHRFKEKHPNTKLWLYAYKHTFPLFDNNPYVDGIIERSWTFNSLVKLRSYKFDKAILFEMLKTPIWAYLANIPLRRGTSKDENGFALTEDVGSKENISVNCIGWQNIIAGVDNKYYIPELYGEFVWKTYDDCIVIFPDAGITTIAKKKSWPLDNWIRLINKFKEERVVVVGSDKFIGYKIKTACPFIYNMMGKLNIDGALSLINEARLVITNDSFALHASAAFNKPTLTIFGPTDPAYLAPYKNVTAISASLPCSPCFYNDAIIQRCQTQECLKRINVDKVYTESQQYL